jgi:hypothetical protein
MSRASSLGFVLRGRAFPARRAQGGGLWAMFRSADAVDYYEGEQPPTISEE